METVLIVHKPWVNGSFPKQELQAGDATSEEMAKALSAHDKDTTAHGNLTVNGGITPNGTN